MRLEPGGYIQWEDADLCNHLIRTKQVEEFDQQMKELFKLAGRDNRYLQIPCFSVDLDSYIPTR